jgi:hypothetical protein
MTTDTTPDNRPDNRLGDLELIALFPLLDGQYEIRAYLFASRASNGWCVVGQVDTLEGARWDSGRLFSTDDAQTNRLDALNTLCARAGLQ